MRPRSRIAAFGACAVLVVAGAAGAALVGGGLGQILALVLIGLGLVGVVSLVFLEVGLSEDRERSRHRPDSVTPPRPNGPQQHSGPAPSRPAPSRPAPSRAGRPRLDRRRGRSRRLER